MRVELRRLSDLRPYGHHARRAEAAVAAMMASVAAFGFRQPIVADRQGVIICGHARYLAAKALGLRRVPVHVARDLTAAQARAYRIADNKLAELAGWDEAILREELTALRALNCDLELLGFTEVELEEILEPETPPAEAGWTLPLAEKVQSRRGTLYRLGRHRLLVGDATEPAEVARVMGGARAELLLTDPPYNVDYRGGTADGLRMANDSMSEAAFAEFLGRAFKAADAVLRPGAAFYLWHPESGGLVFREACRGVGWRVRQCLIWVKNSLVLGRQDYQWRHEPCLYGWKDGAPHTWLGRRRRTSIVRAEPDWEISAVPEGYCMMIGGTAYLIRGQDLTVQPYPTTVLVANRPHRSGEHPTMKPVELFEGLIRNSARKQDLVVDPFVGSGTTILACERTGRAARAMELDERYADVCRRRWAEAVHGEGCDWLALTPPVARRRRKMAGRAG